MSRITLAAHGYELAVNRDYGANLTALRWRHPDGRLIDILRSCDDTALIPGEPSPVGCFPMAPFANRIDGGRFSHAGRDYALPINRPQDRCAIHGFSRFAAFEIISQGEGAISLLHRHRGDIFAYDLVQDIVIDARGLAVRLAVTNRGAAMPFGVGLHPYFRLEAGARLRFKATLRSQSDDRYLPLLFVSAQTAPDLGGGIALSDVAGFDAHYSGWQPRLVALERPSAGLSIKVRGEEAFSNLHLYVGPDRDFVCIEPVSHVPDAHNRSDLAQHGKLAVLGQGEVLAGTMRISVSEMKGLNANGF
jgi:aldose 1-epimerase